ncbi:MAG: hypothetical protein KF690_00995 [Bacteroidetes bacterium]|nr:hypothetical protein [Bacteroidota bacterium]
MKKLMLSILGLCGLAYGQDSLWIRTTFSVNMGVSSYSNHFRLIPETVSPTLCFRSDLAPGFTRMTPVVGISGVLSNNIDLFHHTLTREGSRTQLSGVPGISGVNIIRTHGLGFMLGLRYHLHRKSSTQGLYLQNEVSYVLNFSSRLRNYHYRGLDVAETRLPARSGLFGNYFSLGCHLPRSFSFLASFVSIGFEYQFSSVIKDYPIHSKTLILSLGYVLNRAPYPRLSGPN